jgi:putative transposase
MRSKTVAQLLIYLGVAKSHSRPHTPTDNPYSEAQFKTIKYRPDYPKRFNGKAEARRWAQDFFHWYNHEHHHTGLGLMTPAAVHYGLAKAMYEQRRQVLAEAYAAHPERFVRGAPVPPHWPKEVWINPPQGLPGIADQPETAASEAGPRWPDEIRALLPKFETELSQSH